MGRGFFVCFTGIDGSGKSTQAKLLVANLSARGIPAKFVYARYSPVLLRPYLIAGNLLFVKTKHDEDDYVARTAEKKVALDRHRVLSKIFYFTLIFDYYVQLAWKVGLPILLGKRIVCDRYVYDTIITDIAVDLGLTDGQIVSLAKKMMSVLPGPDIVLVIDVPEEIAFGRKNDVASIDYLRDRRAHYRYLADNTAGFEVVNGTENVGEVGDRILERVMSALEWSK